MNHLSNCNLNVYFWINFQKKNSRNHLEESTGSNVILLLLIITSITLCFAQKHAIFDFFSYVYFAASSSASLTYASLAASFVVPFFLFHASHLALPLKSRRPGFSVSLSPTVPCLKYAYSSSNSSSLGRFEKFFTLSAASLNFCNKRGRGTWWWLFNFQ